MIGFPDFFSIGPIWELHKEVGRKYRHEWLKDHINMEKEMYEKNVAKLLSVEERDRYQN